MAFFLFYQIIQFTFGIINYFYFVSKQHALSLFISFWIFFCAGTIVTPTVCDPKYQVFHPCVTINSVQDAASPNTPYEFQLLPEQC